MQVELIKNCHTSSGKFRAGDFVDVPAEEAALLVSKGMAKPEEKKAPDTITTSADVKPKKKKKKKK